MPTKSVSRIITRDADWLGPAIPPGETLLEEYLKPLGLGQVQAAERLGVSLNRLNEIVLGKARDHCRYGASAVAPAEDVGAALDAAAGRLGPAPSLAAGEAQGVVRSLYLFCT